MAVFNFTTTLPQEKAEIVSNQLRQLFDEIQVYLTTVNPEGTPLPEISTGAQFQALLINAALNGFDLSHILRSNVALENDAGAGTNNQVLKSDGDNTVNWTNVIRSNIDLLHDAGIGSSGQLLRSDGDGTTSWVTAAIPNEWVDQASGFTAADGGRYVCDGGVTVTLFTPNDNDEFYIRPNLSADFEVNPVVISRVASESIAGAASDFTCNLNGVYHFFSDGTNWDVSLYEIGRL